MTKPARASESWLLAIDTATTRIVVGAGRLDGATIQVLEWPAGHRHGELLLKGIESLLDVTGLGRDGIAGIVVGTGPGAFTGLRVGLATAKTMAHALAIPIAGIGTGEALLDAARLLPAAEGHGPASAPVLLLPAGPHDRVLVRSGAAPQLLPGGHEPDAADDAVVAVDLDGRATAAAAVRGEAARAGLGPALLRLGAARLRGGDPDSAAALVPEYVTLPRGIREATGEIEWSHDPR